MSDATRFLMALLLLLAAPLAGRAADVPVAEDTSSTPSGLSSGAGKSKSLAVQDTRATLLRFSLASLPLGYDADTLQSARLRIYATKVASAGDLTVHEVTAAWSEAGGAVPTVDGTPIATVAGADVHARSFLVVDVTDTVREWLTTPEANFGLAIAAGDEGTKLAFAAKEGPGSGPAAELEIEALLLPGSNNTVAAGSSVIGGGVDNEIDPTAEWGVIPGGLQNEIGAGADYAFAAGRRAHAFHTGSFVFADSTNADFTSTADNQLSIRMANGLFIANDAGGAKVVPVGTRYRDNAIVAWARVTAAGGLDTNFNVASVTKVGTGVYRMTLNSSLSSGFSLIPVVTPEVDPAVPPDTPPVGDANLRIAAANNVAAGNTFDVYMYNGVGTLVDNDFSFLVTGR
jgi:hypothetical protein